jgi:hypothetical protein
MKAYGGVDVWIHIFLTSALAGGEWSASRPCLFTPKERPSGTHWTGGWMDHRASPDNMEKWKFLPPLGLELWPLGHPALSQSQYRLHYPSCTFATTASYSIKFICWFPILLQMDAYKKEWQTSLLSIQMYMWYLRGMQ